MHKDTNATADPAVSLGDSNWASRNPDDAMLVVLWGDVKICRVVAVTEDGRCVAEAETSAGVVLVVEDSPGYWAKVGYFVQEYRGFWNSLFGSPGWRFVPNSSGYLV